MNESAGQILAQPTPTQVVAAEQKLSIGEVVQHVALIRSVMANVMVRDKHYGVIPGTDKPSLWKPGAELLCMTFRIAPHVRQIDDLSVKGMVRYRITMEGVHQVTGAMLGEGVGECSSHEEKYKWRKAVRKEWENTPEDMRRTKFGYNRQRREEFEILQVRTEPADLANTILKMAVKRAHIAMTLAVLAASDVFNQDLEDLTDELRDHIVGVDADEPQKKDAPPPPQRKSGAPPEGDRPPSEEPPGRAATEGEVAYITKKLEAAAITPEEFQRATGIVLGRLTLVEFNKAKKFLADPAGYAPDAAEATAA
jgi:hypothetical protein